jgi:hypothetical protein
MKKASSKSSTAAAGKSPVVRRRRKAATDEMRSHYGFDYSKARPNRFAERFSAGSVAIVLDPDVASVFQSPEAVNAFLRSAIAAMPGTESRRKKRSA